ncbi:MAG: hypothetical protein ACLT63_16175 [Bacteroides xylanisolvens]
MVDLKLLYSSLSAINSQAPQILLLMAAGFGFGGFGCYYASVTAELAAEDGTWTRYLSDGSEMMMVVAEVDQVTFILPLLLLTILKAVF